MKKLLMASLLALLGGGALAECKRQALEIPVEIVNHRPVVTMKIEGTELRMLLDTGAFHSMLMPSVAAQMQLPLNKLPAGIELQGYSGRIEAKMTKVKDVNFHGLPYRNIEFIVGGNELGSGIQGILGRNFLRATDVEYDLGQGLMRLHVQKGDCAGVHPVYWAEGVPVIEARLDSDAYEMRLAVRPELNGRTITAMLDTGAPMSTLTLRAARRAGVEQSQLVALGRTGGAGDGSAKVWSAMLERFELGGQTVRNLKIQVAGVSGYHQDLLIGLDYFLSHRIYVSRSRATLYATWNGGPIFTMGAVQRDGDALTGALTADLPLDDAPALARVAAATHTRGDPATALQQFNRVVELAPAEVEYRMGRARSLLALKRSAEALSDLNEALRLQPQASAARLMRAQLRAADAESAPAPLLEDLQHLDRELAPSAHERFVMARLYAHRGELSQALRQWELWLQTRSKDRRRADAYAGRCWLRVRLNLQLDEALKDCEAAVEVDARDPEYHDGLGWAHWRRGEWESALKAFNRALRLDQRYARSLYGRSRTLAQLRDPEAAERDQRVARQLRPELETVLARLEAPSAEPEIQPE